MFARPGLPSFDYVRPGTADEVIGLLQEHGEAARLLMGGTDLFPGLRDGAFRPKVVVDVKGLPGMRDILFDRETGLTVGAAVTMNALANHPDVQAHYPLLAEAAGTVASYQIRNRATLGGNLCNASPCADTSPATLVLEARLCPVRSQWAEDCPRRRVLCRARPDSAPAWRADDGHPLPTPASRCSGPLPQAGPLQVR